MKFLKKYENIDWDDWDDEEIPSLSVNIGDYITTYHDIYVYYWDHSTNKWGHTQTKFKHDKIIDVNQASFIDYTHFANKTHINQNHISINPININNTPSDIQKDPIMIFVEGRWPWIVLPPLNNIIISNS